MAFEIFGFTVGRAKDKEKEKLEVLELGSDAADAGIVQNIDYSGAGFSSAAGVLDGMDSGLASVPNDEVEAIRKYREIAITAEVDEALTEIRNEAFIFSVPGKKAFDIGFIDVDEAPSTAIQKKIREQFNILYDVVNFHDMGRDYFNRWYIDGRIFFQKVIDQNNPKKGVRKISRLDPLNIRRIKVIPRQHDKASVDLNKVEEFYIYARRFDESMRYGVTNVVNYDAVSQDALKILPDAICKAYSGLRDLNSDRTIGYLHKAVVPYNNLKMMEDAMVIFRIVRAPQRRAIYVDVGQLQKNKADGYIKELMARFKNRMAYDTKTGLLTDKRNVMSMVEDYWLPRREGSKGTEIQTLDGQDSSNILEEVEYARDKLWRSLGVPRSRFGEQSQSFVFGKGIEIQRDEYRFKTFLDNLRRAFLEFFEDLLRTQLILTNVITDKDWDQIRRTFFWTYAEDNAFIEFKESEIINNRINTLAMVDPYVGKYFTVDWVRKNVLRQTDEEIEAETEKMDKEEKAGLYDQPADDEGQQIGQPRYFDTGNPIQAGASQGAPIGAAGSETSSASKTIATSQ